MVSRNNFRLTSKARLLKVTTAAPAIFSKIQHFRSRSFCSTKHLVFYIKYESVNAFSPIAAVPTRTLRSNRAGICSLAIRQIHNTIGTIQFVRDQNPHMACTENSHNTEQVEAVTSHRTKAVTSTITTKWDERNRTKSCE
ncbi:hypothetical protein Trydic_g21715 [Trypoxylus dichotomus]